MMNYHIVEKGESLWLIAQKYHLTLQDLLDANPQISDPNYILIGEKIFLPDDAEIAQPLPRMANQDDTETYRADEIDELKLDDVDIAHHRPTRPGRPPFRPNQPGGNHPNDEKPNRPDNNRPNRPDDNRPNRPNRPDDNRPNHPHRPQPEIPVLPNCWPDGDCDASIQEICQKLRALPRPLIYVVREGDTLYQIAKCFEISLKELIRVNPHINNPDFIQAGDKIFIPRPRNIIMPREMSTTTTTQKFCPYCGSPIK